MFADRLAERSWPASTPSRSTAPATSGSAAAAGRPRPVHVTSPFDGETAAHVLAAASAASRPAASAGAAGSDADGRPAHHLLDPRTGRPAFTGVVQATALAPTAAQAEVLAKAALLSGPERAAEWLRYGGVFVRDDGSYEVLEPAGCRADAACGRQPAADVGQHGVALGLVEDLVVEAVVGLDRLVRGADPLGRASRCPTAGTRRSAVPYRISVGTVIAADGVREARRSPTASSASVRAGSLPWWTSGSDS